MFPIPNQKSLRGILGLYDDAV